MQDPIEAGGAWICAAIQTALQENRGLAIGKLGTSELALLTQPLTYGVVHNATHNAGLWPVTELKQWTDHMLETVLLAMDALVEWQGATEKTLLNQHAKQSHRLVLRALEPYYQADPKNQWTHCLPADIAVISPFATSIQTQVQKGLRSVWIKKPDLWTDEPRVHCIRTGCSPFLDSQGDAAWPAAILKGGWRAAVDACVQQVLATPARLVLVGCGALSLPIVAALKQAGCVAIHLGGATQILFGIRGLRWDKHSVIAGLYGPAWISPAVSETPRGAQMIEGGCYW